RDVDLSATEYLVLDEADRMLDMGFIKDVRKIIATMPTKRQTLLFSATMPGAVAKFAGDILNAPQRVEIESKSVAVERIYQTVQHVNASDKRRVLTGLLRDEELERVIVFTRTKYGAEKVARWLNRDGIDADALHGNKTQSARQRTLESFRKGKTRVLVATDIASRGIDVDEVTHVINYELPNEPESYVHRIGRTARAGSRGAAISLCSPDERAYLKSIEKLIKRPLRVVGDVPVETVEPAGQNQNRRGGKPGSGAPKRRRRSRRPFKKAA
ncbi:MAG: DEAD/DEAH box helicase, partial [Rhizobiales bacterium]|nr:DEAD/DEAH box helicase [Hyphomicrobiales bacterium]